MNIHGNGTMQQSLGGGGGGGGGPSASSNAGVSYNILASLMCWFRTNEENSYNILAFLVYAGW